MSQLSKEWVWSPDLNVCIVNDRDLLTNFEWIQSFVEISADGKSTMRAWGIGNVRLDAKISLTRTGDDTHHTLILKDVLWVPECKHNVFSGHGHNFHTANKEGDVVRFREIEGDKGTTCLFVPSGGLMKMKLAGQHLSTIAPDAASLPSKYTWPSEEKYKWHTDPRLFSDAELSDLTDDECFSADDEEDCVEIGKKEYSTPLRFSTGLLSHDFSSRPMISSSANPYRCQYSPSPSPNARYRSRDRIMARVAKPVLEVLLRSASKIPRRINATSPG